MHLVPFNRVPRGLKLLRKLGLPTSRIVELPVKDTAYVRGNLNISSPEHTHPVTSKSPNKVAQFKHHVLAGTRFRGVAFLVAFDIRSKQNHSKANIGVRFDLLDDSPVLAGLLMQNDRLKPDPFKKPSNCFS